MKKIFIVLALCAMVLSAVPSSAQESELPRVVVEVLRNRDFFAKPWILWGYEKCFLHDMNRLNEGRIGVTLLSPSGFEIQVVYDVETLDAVYTDMRVPEKSARGAMRRESISVADAVKLARGVAKYPNGNR
jgi:hypothetical protein